MAAVAPLRARLIGHPLYARLDDEAALRRFMETHVYAVWDFQSLLKALQRALTCTSTPWWPTADAQARRWINEIVLDEESDLAPDGTSASHFELYVRAMRAAGADAGPVLATVDGVRRGLPVPHALAAAGAPRGAAAFVGVTLAAADGPPHRTAAAFALGREDVIPAMFARIVERLASQAPARWGLLRHYLDRHVGADAERHAPHARRLVARLCGDDAGRWREAEQTVRDALAARAALWDDILRRLDAAAPTQRAAAASA